MRWFIGVLGVLVLVLQYRIWFSPGGARELARLDDAVTGQLAENASLAARNEQLAAEVRDLKQGFAAVEERARSELGLVGPNETYYQVVPPETSRRATDDAAPRAEAGATSLAATAP